MNAASIANIVAGLALFVSLVSAWIAYDAKQEATALQRPIIGIDAIYATALGPLGIVVRNNGATSAKIHSFEMGFVDGTPEQDGQQFLLTMADFGENEPYQEKISRDTVLRSGSRFTPFSVAGKHNKDTMDAITGFIRSRSINICYCTIDDARCWKQSWAGNQSLDDRKQEDQVKLCSNP